MRLMILALALLAAGPVLADECDALAGRILRMEMIEVRIVEVTSILEGEFTENEMRQDFTPSERVATVPAMRERLGTRHGSNQHARRGEDMDRGPTPQPGVSRDLAAKRAGFESGHQLDRASNVVKFGAPALVEAMDRGTVSITAAAEIAKAAPSTCTQVQNLPFAALLAFPAKRSRPTVRFYKPHTTLHSL